MVEDQTNKGANDGSSGVVSTTRRQDPLIGTLVAERYRILDLLGRGGMGVVYKARHELMERTVAIKLLLPQLVSDESAAARFQREARASSKISHSNIIALHDFGRTHDGVPYIVMDYIEGESLADLLKREKQIGTSRSARIFAQVCDALSHAHGLGIIHRDLKPGNIMIVQNEDQADVVKVVDFGIAKMYESEDNHDAQRLTTTGELFGSPVYMSPEQCSGFELDARSDIYSLGCVMYETLTGKLPCAGKTVLETISKQLASTPPPFSTARPDLYIPDWMEQIVNHALQKEPGKRPQSMRDMQNLINTGLTSYSTSSVRAINSSAVSMKTRAVNSSAHIKAIPAPNKKKKSKGKDVEQPEWKRYALYTALAVTLIGGIMFGISMFAKTTFKEPSLQDDAPDAVPQKTEKTDLKSSGQKMDAEQNDAPVETPAHSKNRKHSRVHAADGTTTETSEQTNNRHNANAEQAITHARHTEHPVAQPRHVSSVPTDSASDAPAPANSSHSRHKRGSSDYFDFASKHEHENGDPVDLPVKQWSPD